MLLSTAEIYFFELREIPPGGLKMMNGDKVDE
jgi:hypothetical protein